MAAGAGQGVAAPAHQSGSLWRDAPQIALLSPADAARLPRPYRLLTADVTHLQAALAAAPVEGKGDAMVILELPLPDGGLARFQLEEYVMLEPGLAAKFPTFKTYVGRGVDDPTTTARVSWTSVGLHALMLSPGGAFQVAPYRSGDVTHYVAFDAQATVEPWTDATVEAVRPSAPHSPQATSRSNAQRRTYRLAVAATGEYSQAHGGTIPDTLAAIVAAVNELNGVYESEFSIRFTLVANNDQIIYLDPDTDPYTNDDTGTLLNENQPTLDEKIGSANYDVGHVFRSGSSGRATLGTPCRNGSKARSTSNGGIYMMAHEMGHQFSSNHTQNAYGDSCGRVESQAYEPGSGSTIMSYGGKCDQSILDSGESLAYYFHTSSFDVIMDYVTNYDGSFCPAISDPGNAAPAVEAGPAYTIPRGTPFILTGAGSDTDGDSLTYTWEEFDLGPAPITITVPNTDADGNARPIFRSFPPGASPARTFPRLAAILDGSNAGLGESLPTISRVMQFRLTARDGRGGVSYDTTTVSVSGAAGPFRITTPDGVIGWPRGSRQTLTWDVANTTAAPVSCPIVNLLLSTDDGQTFPTTLAANTPNDGSEPATLPDSAAIGLTFKVVCANNIFFDINKTGAVLCTSVFHDDHEAGFTGWLTGTTPYFWTTRTDGGFSGNNYFHVPDANGFFSDHYLTSPSLTVAGATPVLGFMHKYATEMRGTWASDGGVVELSVNGGAWKAVSSAAFIQNGYNTVVTTSNAGLIGGQPAFGSDSKGYQLSLVDLNPLVQAGDTIRVRFHFSKDGWTHSGDEAGWSVDDLLLCHSDPAPALTIAKTVTYGRHPIQPGDPVTYTVVVANTGGADATGVHVTDALPAGVSGASLDQTVTITAHDAVTWTIPATVAAAQGTIINTAAYTYPSAQYCPPTGLCTDTAQVSFIVNEKTVYLPLVLRN